jgi:predicted RNase H-like HicB family nuclease
LSRYFAILEKEPDSLWSVFFPDLPGCVAAADNADNALANAAAALREVTEDMVSEGRPLPEARSIEELRVDAEVKEALAAGAALIAIPLLTVDTASE